MLLRRKTAPSAALIPLDDAKRHCRVDHTDDDAFITALCGAVESYLDGYAGIMGRALVSQVWELVSDERPCGALKVPLGPVVSVGSVEYVGPSGGPWQTWAAESYTVTEHQTGAVIAPVAGWPPMASTGNVVKVTFTAGYGAAATDVPAAIRQAALLLIGHWYETRETVNIGDIASELPFSVAALLAPFRVHVI